MPDNQCNGHFIIQVEIWIFIVLAELVRYTRFNCSVIQSWMMMTLCSKRCMLKEGSKRRSHLNWRCTTKGCSRLNCATNGKRPVHAHTVITANLLTASKSFAQLSATPATRLRCAGWSLPVMSVPMATVATSAMHSLNKKSSWATLVPGL